MWSSGLDASYTQPLALRFLISTSKAPTSMLMGNQLPRSLTWSYTSIEGFDAARLHRPTLTEKHPHCWLCIHVPNLCESDYGAGTTTCHAEHAGVYSVLFLVCFPRELPQKSLMLMGQPYLPCLCGKFKVGALHNCIHWTCFLAQTTVDAFCHINVISAERAQI